MPDTEKKLGAGKPVVASWNGKLVVKPVSRLGRLLVLMAGGWFTVNVKFCVVL